ncbi:unnamed protein product [Linum trigynum]|uniref:Uncharacterized protein n=1 Tax=Linum trigynum TaxID=586398 RepID=A0AAV2G0P1_9ROSI
MMALPGPREAIDWCFQSGSSSSATLGVWTVPIVVAATATVVVLIGECSIRFSEVLSVISVPLFAVECQFQT